MNLKKKLLFPIESKKGMTLVEIMIVMGILVALIALLLPKLTGQQAKARINETKIHMGQIINGIAMYNNDCRKNPASLESLIKPDSTCSNWGPEAYIKFNAKDPELKDAWGNPYTYETSGNTFVLKSYGADGKEGGSGADTDISSDDL